LLIILAVAFLSGEEGEIPLFPIIICAESCFYAYQKTDFPSDTAIFYKIDIPVG
jgi:hypothetical protein